MYYKLEDRIPVPCTKEEFEEFMNTAAKLVGQQYSDDKSILVSTTFCGVDLTTDTADQPKMFETLVLKNDKEIEHQRYTTWEVAEKGHEMHVLEYL